MNILELGSLALRLALPVMILATIIASVGIYTREKEFAESSRRFTYINLGLHLLAFVSLGMAFLNDRFQLLYVWQHSNIHMPDVYKLSAIWGGMEGSLLLWSFILSLFIALYAFFNRRDIAKPSYKSGCFFALFLTQIFFLYLLNLESYPFEHVPVSSPPADGRGLNPLLQNPGMAIHPPLLYLGFVGLTLPFAMAIGALISGHLGNHWLGEARTWSLVAWMILGVGIARGGMWAYQELGWGGYWAWDPVENASFMPWLLATAFLHSIIIQKQRGMLKIWNMTLAVLVFAFTILGTFLTRSGAISSVHTFARNKMLGITFLSFLGLTLFGGIGLMLWRRKQLQAEHSIKSFFSREFMFVLNNFVLVGLTFVILWGTILPTITELFTGTRRTVGAPYFNLVATPLFILLILLIGVGSLIAWRETNKQNLIRNFTAPTLSGLVFFPLFYWITSSYSTFDQFTASAMGETIGELFCSATYAIVVFVAVATIQEYYRGVMSRLNRFNETVMTALYRLFSRNQTRYGGYFVHLGVLVVVIGVATNVTFKSERKLSVQSGRTFTFAGHELTYEGYKQFWIPSKEKRHAQVLQANMKIRRPGESKQDTFYLYPQQRAYQKPEQTTTEVAVDKQLFGDLYVVLNGVQQDDGLGMFTLYYNPFILILWFGVGIIALGGLLCVIPLPDRKTDNTG